MRIHLWLFLSALALAAIAIAPAASRASWLPNGNPVAHDVIGVPGWSARVVSDGAGGAFVAWAWFNSGVAHLDPNGDPVAGWPLIAPRLFPPRHTPFWPMLIADGAGRVLVVAAAQDCDAHCQGDPTELRVTALDGHGAPLAGWPDEGVSVGTAFSQDPLPFPELDGRMPIAITDGDGGLIVLWAELAIHRWDPTEPRELRAQRIAPDGMLVWGPRGVVVRSASRSPLRPAAVADGKGGCFVFWNDERAPGLYAQHVSSDGSADWEADGRALAHADTGLTTSIAAVADGSHGAIAVWRDSTADAAGIFATRVNLGGGTPWGERVVVRSADPSRLDSLRAVATPGGDAIVAWRERGSDDRILAQRLSHGGRPQWSSAGLAICVAPGQRDHLGLAGDGADGAYFAWSDSRRTGSIFASHVDGGGQLAAGWRPDGVPVCAQLRGLRDDHPPVEVSAMEMFPDGAGGALLGWTDDRDDPCAYCGFHTAFATRLGASGPIVSPPVALTELERHFAGPLLATPVAVEAHVLSVRAVLPSVAGSPARAEFTLADDSPAALALFDVAGRRVWTRDLGAPGAGVHAVAFGAEVHLAPGVYVLRLAQGGRSASRPVVISH